MENIGLIILALIALVVILILISASFNEKEQNEKAIAERREYNRQFHRIFDELIHQMKVKYEQAKGDIAIPYETETVGMETTVFGMQCSAERPAGFKMWFDERTIYIFPTEKHFSDAYIQERAYEFANGEGRLIGNITPDDVRLTCINYEEIEYFVSEGDIESELHISGGGGGGSSITGAVIGGLIGGGAGAIIGSRKEIQPILSRTTKVDYRFVAIVHRENGRVRYEKLSQNAYEILQQHIPEKEYAYVQTMALRDAQSFPKDVISVADEIRKYAQLKEDGIISEEEFVAKKKNLLDL